MIREGNNKPIHIWLEDLWEEIEIQLYGITGAILFFLFVYLFFNPLWMKPLVDFVNSIKLYILDIISRR